ncbi:amino acid permease [Streptomyces sp. NRRL S-378]|uniref:amino acid permease n=1 Tax=Streptomyces sp. NRRL S-378 TaxID=1463904 RepID=UPI0005605FAF|nr:amino acid permease [Streptomyces sp. NRRL S-378]
MTSDGGQAFRGRHLTMMAMGGAVGTGLFVGSAETIRAAGPAALVSYALAGLLVLLVMRMLGEMVAARPMAGSFADYARLAFGDWAGFTVGWLYWYAFVAIVAIEAIAGGQIVHGWLPQVPAWTCSLVLLGALTAVNLRSSRSFGTAEFWFALVKIGAIAAFLVLGGAYLLGGGPSGPVLGNLTAHGGFAPHGFGAVLTATVGVVFAFGGTEIVAVAAAECPDPGRAVARATRQIVWRILVFFLGSVLLVVAIVPWPLISGEESPYVTALDRMGVPFAASAMSMVILTALLSVLGSTLYASSRMLHTLAGHGDAPRWAAVPRRAVLLGTVVGCGAVVAQALSPGRTFPFLLNSTGAVLVIMYLGIALSQFVLRVRTERTEPERLTFRMWGFPHLTLLVVLALSAILCSMLFSGRTRPQLLMSLGSLGVVLVAGVLRRVWRRTGELRFVNTVR